MGIIFLEGVRQTSENSIQTFKSIIQLRHEYENSILSLGNKVKSAKAFLNFLFRNPVTDSQSVKQELSMSMSASLRLVDDFIRLGILKEVTGYKRNRVFVFDRYLKLFE